MKKLNKKGFTIVELVIVIAVIAILAGVMIPSFSYVIEQANAAAQEAEAAELYKQAYAVDLADGLIDFKTVDGEKFPEADGWKYETSEISYTKNDKTIYFVEGEWTATKPN